MRCKQFLSGKGDNSKSYGFFFVPGRTLSHQKLFRNHNPTLHVYLYTYTNSTHAHLMSLPLKWQLALSFSGSLINESNKHYHVFVWEKVVFFNILKSILGYSCPLCIWPIKIQCLGHQRSTNTSNSVARTLGWGFIEEFLYFPYSSTVH